MSKTSALSHAEKAVDLAEKITAKAEGALSGLALEMNLMKWPEEFRAIVWGAVADIAARRRDDAERAHQQSPASEKKDGV